MSGPAISEFDTLKDVVAAGRERDGTALDVVRRPAPYSYHDLCTSVWKTGNLLGHYGVHALGELAVAVGPKADAGDDHRDAEGTLDAAEPLLAILGGTIIGGVVDVTPTEPVDAPALVAPAHWRLEFTASCSRLAYGGPPTDPTVSHFEREVWSENPIEPPESVAPADDALRFDDETWPHEALLSSTAAVVSEYDLDSTTRVVLGADITEPGGFVAGVLAPLAVGAAIVVPDGDTALTGSELLELKSGGAKSVAVTENESGETVVAAEEVTRSMRDTGRV